jgi:hypothetical protein
LIGTCYPGHDFGSIAPTILKQIKEECKQNNDALDTLPQSIVSVEYRRTELAPTPGALIDALSVYRHLVDDLHFKPSNISLSGDSAGGHLVNSLIRYLVEGGEETPGKIVLISVSDLLSRASLNLIDMLLPYYSPGAIKPGQQLSRAIRHSNECYHMTFLAITSIITAKTCLHANYTMQTAKLSSTSTLVQRHFLAWYTLEIQARQKGSSSPKRRKRTSLKDGRVLWYYAAIMKCSQINQSTWSND